MADTPETKDDEIDLSELFASLWAYKSLIAIVTVASIIVGGLYALKTTRIYTGEAVFQLEDSGNSGLSLSSEVSGLAALAGLSGVASEGNVLFDLVRGRAFILDVDKAVDLRGDEYFNKYDPNSQDPAWKAVLKTLIGYESADVDPDQVIEKNIVDSFRGNVLVEETDNGSMSIKVDHTDPVRAAQIANAVMDGIVARTQSDTEARQGSQLTYLSETLADTLREMEDAQARLKNFAIENSTLSLEALAAGSVALDEIRNRLDRATALHDAANALLEAVDKGETGEETYARLRQSHPIIDDVEFRRVLGISEIISAFTWPDRDLLAAVSATLEDRRERIEREKARLEQEAVVYANAAERQAALEREAKVAEASYTVLIEQVKAQSLLAGYQGETAKIFERAAVPLSPSKPNRKLVLALAGLLGIFVSTGIALFLSLRKGVFFSRHALRAGLLPDATVSAARLKKLNGKTLKGAQSLLSGYKQHNLSEIAVSLRGHPNPYAVFLSGNAKCTARSAMIAAAVAVAASGRKVAVIDLSGPASPKCNEDGENKLWSAVQSDGGITEVAFAAGPQNIGLLASPKFNEIIRDITKDYDLVLFSAEHPIAEMSVASLAALAPKVLLAGRPTRTPKSLIHKLRSLKLPTILMLE